MTDAHAHTTHPALMQRLERAAGHLRHAIAVIGSERPHAEIAAQVQAVERAVMGTSRTLVHDHTDHCPGADERGDPVESRELAKLP